MNARIALLLIALPLALAGCGNKGPLVLPPKPVPVEESTLPPEGTETPPPTEETTPPPKDETPPPADSAKPTDTPTHTPPGAAGGG